MKNKKHIVLVLIGVAVGALLGSIIMMSMQDKSLKLNNQKVNNDELINFLVDYDGQQALKDFVIYNHLKDSNMFELVKQQGVNSNTLYNSLEEEYINKLIEDYQKEFDKEYKKSLEQLEVSYYSTSSVNDAQDIKMLVEQGYMLLDAVVKVAGDQEAMKISKGTENTKELGINKGVMIKKDKKDYYIIQVDSLGLMSKEEFKKEFAMNLETYMFDAYVNELYLESQAEWGDKKIFY
ncbi:hypothetical protein QTG56_23455 (plasmid) [Rossellomorea sp. AcN35-11]|nr:hypothetical protein [Rossellomorea aquimaris]WJV32322.1 hypothetical protein QTG56_23455 [Rossellomorea sp. AcN35-11]